MAKSSKSKTGKSKIDTSVNDAVEVTEDEVVVDGSPRVSDPSDDDIDGTSADETTADAIAGEDDGAEAVPEADLDMKIVDDLADEQVDEPVRDADVELPATTPTPAREKTGGGFVPFVLGGILAGAIGYGVATYFPISSVSDVVAAQVNTQAEQISELKAQLANTPAPDPSAVDAQITEVADRAATQIGDLSASFDDQMASIDQRLSDVEKRPSTDGTLSETALAAYQRELQSLRAEIDAQQAVVMSTAAQAEADLAAARNEAARLEENAVASAQAAAARAALNRMAAAVETGAPFRDALADLGVTDVPPALTDAADTGVATTAQLSADFPATARAALATARSEGVSDDAGGLGGFFRSQFDVRSTAPREGSGPDAVLSRAEAAVREGRVADALAEIDALPEVARAEMTDWTARAQKRVDVLSAIATLSETNN